MQDLKDADEALAPDRTFIRNINFAKSIVRIFAGIALVFNNLLISGMLFMIAEIISMYGDGELD